MSDNLLEDIVSESRFYININCLEFLYGIFFFIIKKINMVKNMLFY